MTQRSASKQRAAPTTREHVLAKLRAICLAQPGVLEKLHRRGGGRGVRTGGADAGTTARVVVVDRVHAAERSDDPAAPDEIRDAPAVALARGRGPLQGAASAQSPPPRLVLLDQP